MRFMLLILGGGSIASALLLGMSAAFPDVMDELGVNLLDLPGHVQWFRDEEARFDKLTAKSKQILDRIAAKDQIARDLAAGRLTLLQAAAQLRDLPCLDSANWNYALATQPGSSADERLCRYLIDWVGYVLSNDAPCSSTNELVLQGLEQQLQTHLQHGSLHLP